MNLIPQSVYLLRHYKAGILTDEYKVATIDTASSPGPPDTSSNGDFASVDQSLFRDSESESEAVLEANQAPPDPDNEKAANGIYWVEMTKGKATDTEKDSQSKSWMWAKKCDLCEEVIRLGSGGGLHSFHQHQGSARCTQQAKKLAEATAKALRPRITDFFKKPMQPLNKPSQMRKHDHTPGIDTPQDLRATVHPPAEANDDVVVACAERDPWTCPGVPLQFPESLPSHYPWHKHDMNVPLIHHR